MSRSPRRIAILADIHGNLPALEAVLEDLKQAQVDEVLVGGDLVGRGPEGSGVIGRIRALGWPAISGNHEEYLLSFRQGKVPEPWLEEEEWAASRWMAAELSSEDVKYIANLPFSLARPGLRLVHGSPTSNRQGIGPWTGADKLAEHWDSVAEDVLVCAHTHRPLRRRVRGGLVVNVGSVGLPFNGDQRAQYAILERDVEGAWEVERRRVAYDLDRIFEIYERSGFLAEGGVTAHLLRLELEHAAPLLVPFLEWAKSAGIPPLSRQLARFLDFHRPGEPLEDFFARLRQLKEVEKGE
jgi:putative phosphoesterase